MILLEPLADDTAGHSDGSEGEAEAQQNAAQIDDEDVFGKDVCQCGGNQRAETEAHHFSNAKSGHKGSEEQIGNAGGYKSAGIIDGKQAALDPQRLGDGRKIHALVAAAESQTDHYHQEAGGQNDPFVVQRSFHGSASSSSDKV